MTREMETTKKENNCVGNNDDDEQQRQEHSLRAEEYGENEKEENEENEEKVTDDEDEDDDEILNLHLKLQASSPQKKTLMEEDFDVPVASLVPVPPDGGWGWVIVFASFMANLVVDGIAYTFGIFVPEFEKSFPESNDSSVALVGSMLCGVYLLVGPIVSGLVNNFGGRSIMIAGSIIGSIGFFISVWSPNVILLTCSYGIIGGIGFGLIYLPAIVYVGYYFEKKRALATGIAVAGSGFGTFMFAPLSVALLEIFGWRGSLWIFAGFILNCAVFGALMRPLPKPAALDKWEEKKQELHKVASKFSGLGLEGTSDWTLSYFQQDAMGRLRRITLQTQASQQSHVSGLQSPALAAIGSTTDMTTDRISRARTGISESSDTGLPISPSVQPPVLEQVEEEPEHETTATENGSLGGSIDKKESQSKEEDGVEEEEESLSTPGSPLIIEGPARRPEAFKRETERLNSIRSSSPAPSTGATSGQDGTSSLAPPQQNPHLQVPPSGSPSMNEMRPQVSRMISRTSRFSVHNYAASMQRLTSTLGAGIAAESYQSLATIDPGEFSRPFSRQDILYTGSVQKLPQFKKSQSNLNKYRESVISIPQTVEMYETLDGRAPGATVTVPVPDECPSICDWLPTSVRHTLVSMIDYKLLKSPVMVLLCISNVFGMLGFYIPFVFLTNFAESLGESKETSSLLLSIIGITNTVGRVVFGAICDRGWLRALTINNFCLIVCGLMTLLVPFFTSYALLVLYSVVFGFLISAYISLTAIVLVDYMGLHNLTNAFGLVILFRGLSSMAGSPLAGAIKESTNSYGACFYFAGSLIVLGGAVSCAIPFVDRWWRVHYGAQAEELVNGNAYGCNDGAEDELDDIMVQLANKDNVQASRTPSPGRSASQILGQS